MYPAIAQSYRRITVRLRSPNADLLRHHPEKGVSKEVFTAIQERFGAYSKSATRVELMLPVDHPDLESLLDLARSNGLKIAPNSAVQSQVEILDYTKPTEGEIVGSKYLEIGLFSPVFECAIETPGKLGIGFCIGKALQETAALPFGSIPNLAHLIVVRDVAKERMESARLRGLKLVPLSTDLMGCEWPDGVGQLYLIWSSEIFPEVNAIPFPGEGSPGYPSATYLQATQSGLRLIDGYEVRPRLCYSNGPEVDVDVALSREIFGPRECYRRIIYSQRARSVMEEIGMKIECIPVRLDCN